MIFLWKLTFILHLKHVECYKIQKIKVIKATSFNHVLNSNQVKTFLTLLMKAFTSTRDNVPLTWNSTSTWCIDRLVGNFILYIAKLNTSISDWLRLISILAHAFSIYPSWFVLLLLLLSLQFFFFARTYTQSILWTLIRKVFG